MAITVTWKGGVYSTANTAAIYTSSPTWTPTANSLLVALVCTTYSASPTDPTSVTGHGITYSALTLGTSTLSTTHKLSIWVAKAGASPTSTAAVANCTTTNGTGGVVIEFEVTGADVSGTALQAIVDSTATNTNTSTAETVTLAAASHFTNRGLIFGVQLSNTAQTSTGTWTLTAGAAGNFNTPATGAAGMFANASFLTAGAMTGANVNWRMVGIEIKAAPPDGVESERVVISDAQDIRVLTDVNDTFGIKFTEATDVTALIAATDSARVTLSEQSVPLVIVDVSDTGRIGLTEAAVPLVSVDIAETRQLVSDDFNRADSGTLGSNWTKEAARTDLQIVTNRCGGTGAAENVDYWSGTGWRRPVDQYSEVVIAVNPAGGDGGPICRSNGSGTYYLCDLQTGGTEKWGIYKVIANVFTQLGSLSTNTVQVGDTARLTTNGTSITTKRNGTTINSVTDSAIDGITVGGTNTGIFIFGTGLKFDNWAAGDGQFAVGLTEGATVAVVGTGVTDIPTADTCQTALSEAVDIVVYVATTETTAVRVSESPALHVTVDGADANTVTITESASVVVLVDSAESLRLTASETATILASVTVTDTLPISISDLASSATIGILPLVDDFNDNSIDPAKWQIAPAPSVATDAAVTVVETGARLEVTPRASQTGQHYNGLLSQSYYNFTGGIVHVEVVQTTTPATSADTALAVSINNLNEYSMTLEVGSVFFQTIANGVFSFTTLTYDSVTMRWWRIRHNTTTDQILFETAPDGITWTTRRTIARSLPITSVQFSIEAGTWESVAVPGKAIFDNFSAGYIQLAEANETCRIAITETCDVLVAINATDALTVAISESSTLDATLTVTESLKTGCAEQAFPFVSVTTPETCALRLSESTEIVVSVATADTTTVQIDESATIVVSVLALDTLPVVVSETSILTADVTVTDSATTVITERTALDVFLAVADSLGLTLTETVALFATLDTTDLLTIQVANAGSVFVIGGNAFEASDTAALELIEGATLDILVAVAESLTITQDEAANIVASILATDAPAIVIAPEGADISVQGAAIAITATDSVVIATLDSATIDVFLSAAEALVASVSEATALHVIFDAPDAIRVQTTETTALLVSVNVADALTMGATELATLLVRLDVDEAVVLVIGESPFGDADTTAADTSVIATGDEPHILVDPDGAADLLGISLDDLARLLDAIASSDSVALVMRSEQGEIETAVAGHRTAPDLSHTWNSWRPDRDPEVKPTLFRMGSRWWR